MDNPLKRNLPTDSQCSKIPKTEEAFDFPQQPRLFTDNMAISKQLFKLQLHFIPFKTSGIGKMFVTNEVLSLLYEKQGKDTDSKVECGISVYRIPNFDKQLDPTTDSQEFWKRKIESFISALKETGETIANISSPFWYKKLNWNSLFTICNLSSMGYDIYVNLYHDEEYEWHLDAAPLRYRIRSSEVPHLSTNLNDLKVTEKWTLPDSPKNTSVWIVDSEFAYNQLDDEEVSKIHQEYYQYSSDEKEFSNLPTASLCHDDIDGMYKHGTVMCKIVTKTYSNRTSIHFVRSPKMGNKKKHIFNIVLVTLADQLLRGSKSDDVALYLLHQSLHEMGYVFCCSAGNVKYVNLEPATQPQIPERPLSFLENCEEGVVVGSHAVNGLKEPCVPSTFGSAGCCCKEEERGEKFIEGVST